MTLNHSTQRRCAVVLMAQTPSPGIDDARIPPLNPGDATTLKHCFLRDLGANIGVIVDSGRAEGVAFFTPPRSEPLLRELLPKNFKLFPQRGDNAREVLSQTIEDLFSRGFSSLCLVNSECPAITRKILEFAIASLAGSRDGMVLGELDRGGYYLIGVNESARDFSAGVTSTEGIVVYAKSRAAALGLNLEMLPPSYEVASARGLNRLCRELLGPDGAQQAQACPYTTRHLARLVETYGVEQLSPDLARCS